MDGILKEIIHCLKCKKKTKNIDAKKVQTNNDRWRISAKCVECNTNKSKFIQPLKDEEKIKNNQKIKAKDKLSIAQELHKPVRKRFPKRKIFTKGIDDLWAADLVIMKNYEKENDNYSYMLNVIDTFSKFAWSYPLKKKDGKSVSKAFEKILKEAKIQNHNPPVLLHTDKGLEFENKLFKEMLKKYEIKMYHTQNEEKSSIIERFNRTLNGKMRIHFEVQNNKKWIHTLQSLLYEYNFKDIHRTIGMKPCEVKKSNECEVLRKVFSENKPKQKIKFKVGDRVRITRFKQKFANKYDPNWTREIFIINEIVYTSPITYKIKDIDGEIIEGTFYTGELQKSKF